MKLILLFERVKNKIRRMYRERVFRLQTGAKALLVGDVHLLGKVAIKAGKNFWIYPNVTLYGDGLIEIGDNVAIGSNSIIYASEEGGVQIGSDVNIAANCYIIDSDHGIQKDRKIAEQSNSVEAVEIGDDVWLGTGVMLLRGSKIGNHAVVGANSVVKGEIPENAVCVGSPARVIKYRS